MMKNKLYFWVAIFVVIVALISVFLLTNKNLPNRQSFDTKLPVSQNAQFPSSQISYDCQSGKTAFDSLKENAKDVKFQGSTLGRFVTGINGIEQSNGKYWLYWVDGKEASISADAYLCQGGEKIEWVLK